MVIKYKMAPKEMIFTPKIIRKGDWIDLYIQDEISVYKGVPVKINFGIAMQLPDGFEAHIVNRSSTFTNYGLIQTNAVGIIDNSYCGDEDWWKGVYYPTEDCVIPSGVRIAQFRIILSQKATFWQKVKWLFSNGVKLKRVHSLNNNNRGGFGEGTGR